MAEKNTGDAGRRSAVSVGSDALRRLFPQLCIPRKRHRCRLCWEWIEVKEPCCRWETLEPGEGYETYHAHPECYDVTLDGKWDCGDWECCLPGEVTRPNKKGQP